MLANQPSAVGQGTTALDEALAAASGKMFRPNPEAARAEDWDDV